MNYVFARTIFAAAALAFSCAGFAADDKLPRGDRSFIDKAMQDGATEVELGKIAQQKSSNDAVKKFAQRMIDDHTKAGDELKGIVSKLGYTPKKEGPNQRVLKDFTKKSVKRFDHEYAEYMVDDHKKAVKLFRKEADKGKTDELKQFASKTLPTLEEHLKMAQDLKAELKKK
jgi:putative membrane protein